MESLNVSEVPCNIPELGHTCSRVRTHTHTQTHTHTHNCLGKYKKHEMYKKQ